MTTLRRILITTVATAAISGIANADLIIGYQTTIGPSNTDLTNVSAVLPAFHPGDSNNTLSNVSDPGLYTTGVSMASLNAGSGFTYTLVGYNISVKETLTGSYTITNSASSAANGSAHVDTYAAVALDDPLSPALTNTADPANDLFACSVTGVGLPSSTCASGEQSTSPGGGPDPNSTQSTTFNIAPGGTFTSAPINVTSKWVDFGCEVSANAGGTPGFCNETSNFQAESNDLATDLGFLEGPPDLTFFLSTATQTTTTVTGGNLQTTYNTQVKEQIEVTYDIVETSTSGTPEPTTMALMGGALIGLGLIGKRFKRS